MSAGRFTNRFYQADSGEIHLLKQQPESASFSANGVANNVPAGPATSAFWFKMSLNNGEYGASPRKVRGRWNPGQAPADYKEESSVEVAIYDPAVYNGITINQPFTHLGGSGVITGKVPEAIFPGI